MKTQLKLFFLISLLQASVTAAQAQTDGTCDANATHDAGLHACFKSAPQLTKAQHDSRVASNNNRRVFTTSGKRYTYFLTHRRGQTEYARCANGYKWQGNSCVK